MKSLQFLTAALIATTLAIGGAGCKKTPKPVTVIPTNRVAAPATDTTTTGPVTPRTGPGTGPGQGGVVPPGTGPGTTGLTDPNATRPVDLDPRGTGLGNERINPDDVTEDPTALQAETVYFDFDRSEVKTTERTKVEAVATYLRNNSNVLLKVEGNCDERGTEEYNRSLGERRALAVREYLATLGIEPARITTISYGEDRPAVPGNDDAAYAKNRRADFVVLRPRVQIQ